MIHIDKKENCCGCASCANICPKNCIVMQADEEGFLYPNTNIDMCINCNLCNKSCPLIDKKTINQKPIVYGCYNKNEAIRQKSTSGGVFYTLCEYIIKNDGVVFGAAFDDEFNVFHDYAETLADCEKFMGSKYVQSVIGDSYKKVKKFLGDNRLVLFTGTPCQIAGLCAFLKKDYDNLYTQDVVCHSVPSPKVWNNYKIYLGVCDEKKITNINFRNKESGWKNSTTNITFDNGDSLSGFYSQNEYVKGFVNGLYSRPSCYSCSFSKISRESDITLGDFWGVDTFYPDLFDNKGTSLVMVNSAKGKKLFSYAKKQLKYKPVKISKAIWYNSAIVNAVCFNQNRNVFFEDKDNNFKDRINRNLIVMQKESKKYIPTFFERIKGKIRHIIGRRK